jgi:hypothetical protein
MKRGLIISAFVICVFANYSHAKTDAILKTEKIVSDVVKASYPELSRAKISVKEFTSEGDYFRAQFSISRFATFRALNFIIFVNPGVYERGAPEAGIRAIIAHELAHVTYYRAHNRFQLLGLARLKDKDFNAIFERKADLIAIERGYGDGLIDYREWLYNNIPADRLREKHRNYFSPDEIKAIAMRTKTEASLYVKWRKRPPRSLQEILAAN